MVVLRPARVAEEGRADGRRVPAQQPVHVPGDGEARGLLDGRNNRGDLVSNARDEVVAKGITINGLPILSEFPTLDYYFEQQVIGGPNHFMISVRDYNSFATAIARKLLQEITGPGIS